jgi:hypothetical protein
VAFSGVKPAYVSATGGERNDVKVTLTGEVHRVALKTVSGMVISARNKSHFFKMAFFEYCRVEDAFCTSEYLGQDTGVLKLDAVTQVYSMLSYSWCVQMIQSDVLVVLLDPGLNSTPSLSNVDLPTLTGDAVNAQCFQVKVILDGLKETGHLPMWKAYNFDVVSLLHCTDAVEG